MRHLWSLLSGLAVAVAALILFSIDPNDLSRGLAVSRILVAGVLIGLVASLRISPVGPIVGGLLLVTPVALLGLDFGLFRDLFLTNAYGADLGGFHLSWLQVGYADGYLGIAGAIMIVAVVSGQRWRAWPRPVDGLVDNGRAARPLDDTLADPAAANDGTTAQLWVQPR
jgi:hypothetical protein